MYNVVLNYRKTYFSFLFSFFFPGSVYGEIYSNRLHVYGKHFVERGDLYT